MKVFVDFSLHSNAISQVAAAKNSFGTYKFLNVTMHVFALLLLRLTYCNLLLNNRLLDNPFITFKPNVKKLHIVIYQCWTEDRSSTAIAKDLRHTAMSTVAEV